MKKLLFEKVFKKAENASGKTSKNGLSEYLSFKITEDYNFRIASKTFVRYYEKYIERNGDEGNDPRTDLLDAIAKYLGYRNFENFVIKNNHITHQTTEINISTKEKKRNNNQIFNINKKRTTYGALIIAVLISYLGYDLTKKDCMIWVTNHYEKIKCKEKRDIKSVHYNEVIFEKLKKVKPDCNYPFFKPDGSENLWYGKSAKGVLEYFTYHGLHPETRKTLDPITQYMIDKHICNIE